MEVMTVAPLRPPGFDQAMLAALQDLHKVASKWAPDAAWDADDLVQETALRALTRSRSFDPASNMGAWLTGILKNLRVDLWRRGGSLSLEAFDGEVEMKATASGGQEMAVDLRSFLRTLDDLTDRQRQAVLLVEVLGLTQRQAADLCGTSTSSINRCLQRARKHTTDIREELA